MSFPSSLNLSDLNGSNGFTIDGIGDFDFSGSSVSGAGDVNGDGIDDIIIGAPSAQNNGNGITGESYVVFGSSSGFSSSFDLSTLDGNNGFAINGIQSDDVPGEFSGYSVSGAGDVNGDGFDDLIIGAPRADINGNEDVGRSYIVFGSGSGFSSSLDLDSLNGSNGFAVDGVDESDEFGRSVSGAGDINGDGIDDLIIGARNADLVIDDPNGNPTTIANNVGEIAIIFGSSNINSNSNRVTFTGSEAGGEVGFSVSGAGDVNGDGFDDIIIGAPGESPVDNNTFRAGVSRVFFGDSNTIGGTNGFAINGIDQFDSSGFSVSGAGDVNGDGFDDIIIGASRATRNDVFRVGESYVVFGNSSGSNSPVDLDNLNGSNGFVIRGIGSNSYSGSSVSGAGDINGDGIDDIIISAPRRYEGESYVVFGSTSGFNPSLDPEDLDGSNGFVLRGVNVGDRSGFSVSGAGDVNGDGIDDIIIGARSAGNNSQGQSYVVFGVAANAAPTITSSTTASVAENQTSAIDVDATDDNDSEGSGLTYSLSGGDDSALFSIDANTGIVTFNTAPDFETPGDANTDNDYEFQVTVTDSTGLTDVRDITVTVTDLDEGNNGGVIDGTNDNDTLNGSTGDDTIRGFGGADEIFGNAGNDRLIGNGGNDTLSGNSGNDILIGGGGRDRLIGNSGDDTLNGDTGNDRLIGQNGNDLLVGGEGRDTLSGVNGNDTLIGGRGIDRLNGGDGADTFVMETSTFNGDRAIVLDYVDGIDKIGLPSGLSFGNNIIAVNNGAGNATLIRDTDVNTTLGVIRDIDAANFDSSDFVII